MTSQELIEKWKTQEINQTIEAEKTYDDLNLNYNPVVYEKIISQIRKIQQKNYNPRIQVRLEMYEVLKDLRITQTKLSPENEKKISDLFQIAASLKDNQILSELYALYAENSSSSFENNLFYIIKSIEIQEEMGTEYFPKFYMRLFFAGLSYYNLSLYNESIRYSQRSLENLGSPKEYLGIYVLNMDLMGTSYFKLHKIDSSFYCYNQIYNELIEYNQNYQNYKEGFDKYNSPYFNTWLGISKGGLARVMIAKENYEEAIPYLKYNIQQSSIHHEYNDVAKAQNLLAEAYTKLGKNQEAYLLSQNALRNSLKKNTLREAIQATKALEFHFKQSGRYDSAYFYSEKKYFYEREASRAINQSKLLSVTNRLQHEKMEKTIAEAENRISQQASTRNLILIICALLLTILISLYYRYRKQKQIELLKLNQKKEQAEKNYLQSQEIIKKSNALLEEFRKKIIQNNAVIENLKNDHQNGNSNLSELQSTTILTKEDWVNFRTQFNKVYPNYYYTLRETYPHLTPAEIRYLCLVKLNLRQNEIAAALGVSDSSVRVTWHRMRKKLEVEKKITPDEFLKKFEQEQLLNQ